MDDYSTTWPENPTALWYYALRAVSACIKGFCSFKSLYWYNKTVVFRDFVCPELFFALDISSPILFVLIYFFVHFFVPKFVRSFFVPTSVIDFAHSYLFFVPDFSFLTLKLLRGIDKRQWQLKITHTFILGLLKAIVHIVPTILWAKTI